MSLYMCPTAIYVSLMQLFHWAARPGQVEPFETLLQLIHTHTHTHMHN